MEEATELEDTWFIEQATELQKVYGVSHEAHDHLGGREEGESKPQSQRNMIMG